MLDILGGMAFGPWIYV